MLCSIPIFYLQVLDLFHGGLVVHIDAYALALERNLLSLMFLDLVKINYLIFIARRFIVKYPLNRVNLLSKMQIRRLPLVRLLLWGAYIWTCSCVTIEIVNVVRRFVYVDVLYYRLTLL